MPVEEAVGNVLAGLVKAINQAREKLQGHVKQANRARVAKQMNLVNLKAKSIREKARKNQKAASLLLVKELV